MDADVATVTEHGNEVVDEAARVFRVFRQGGGMADYGACADICGAPRRISQQRIACSVGAIYCWFSHRS